MGRFDMKSWMAGAAALVALLAAGPAAADAPPNLPGAAVSPSSALY